MEFFTNIYCLRAHNSLQPNTRYQPPLSSSSTNRACFAIHHLTIEPPQQPLAPTICSTPHPRHPTPPPPNPLPAQHPSLPERACSCLRRSGPAPPALPRSSSASRPPPARGGTRAPRGSPKAQRRQREREVQGPWTMQILIPRTTTIGVMPPHPVRKPAQPNQPIPPRRAVPWQRARGQPRAW